MELIELINKHYNNLNDNDLYALQYILEHKQECQDMSITELSGKCNVSTSSIIRMSQKLGFSGYSEFKFSLRKSVIQDSKSDKISENKYYIDLLYNSIQSTIKHFQNTDTSGIMQCLNEAQHVYVYGSGWAQRIAGEQLMRTFFTCKRPIILIQHFSELRLMLSNYTQYDLIIFISLSGSIDHLSDILRLLKINNIPTLSITDFKNNQLATLATYNLYYQANDIDSEANSMGALQVLCELIYLEYLERYKHNKI